MTTTASRALAVLLFATVVAASTAACGSGSSSPGSKKAVKLQARVSVAECMRAHGIDVPDPRPGVSGYGRSLLQLVNSYPRSKVSAAEQACRPYLAQAFTLLSLSPAQQEQRLRQLVRYAECMRAHGIDMPDPRTSGALGSRVGELPTSVTRDSPAFISAHSACAYLKSKRASAG